MSTTPVGYMYSPQQLMGSVRYGSGVLLGNWREDDALDEMRLMDFVAQRERGCLAIQKQKGMITPQLAPTQLTAMPSDGIMRSGDVVMLQSSCNGGVLAVSLGQPFELNGEMSALQDYAVFAMDSGKSVARNSIKIMGFNDCPAGSPLCFGQKIALCFSEEVLPLKGLLASSPSSRSGLNTQVINKQDVFMHTFQENEKVSYECAWCA